MKLLGLDLGTNSLGWSIIEDKKIVDAGVVIFEQGIPLDQGKEAATSPAADRRGFRAMRRLKFNIIKELQITTKTPQKKRKKPI